MKPAHAIMDNRELEIREIAREIPHLRITHMMGYREQLRHSVINVSEAVRRTAVQQLAQKFAQHAAEHSHFETHNDVDGTVTSITCYAMTYDELLDTLRRAYEAGFSCGRRAYKAVCAASLEEKEQQR